MQMQNNEINETPLGTCPTCCPTVLLVVATPLNSLISFVAWACSSYHMSLDVEATTHRMYIGAPRVPPNKPIPARNLLLIIVHSHTTSPMVKVQPHKKVVIQSDLRRQHSSTLVKEAVLPPSRDPRTVCMTAGELSYLLASFRANRWPERAEKERLAQLIGKCV